MMMLPCFSHFVSPKLLLPGQRAQKQAQRPASLQGQRALAGAPPVQGEGPCPRLAPGPA